MPRIPEGQFDTTPSMRVAAPQMRVNESPMNKVGSAVAGLTSAMAQLQDQHERTEAYSKANEIKNNYLQQKAVYESALETVNGKGEVDYVDPSDSEPDVSKRRRIRRPVQEMYQEMVSSYEEQKKELLKLNRGDIASDLARQYVGDDLMQTQMKTNKVINRQREKETVQSLTNNIELNLGAFMETARDPNASEESINLSLSHMNRKIERELATASGIIGTANTQQVQQLTDRAYSTFATQILSGGVTNATVKAADGLVNRIKDPGQKALVMARIENVKKVNAEVKGLATIGTAQGLAQKVNEAPVLGDQDYGGVINAVKNTLNVYTDPKYSTVVTDELKNKEAGNLLSTALASRQMTELMDVDMLFLVDPSMDVDESTQGRSPSGVEAEGPKMRQLKEQIRQEINASGIGNIIGKDPAFAESIVNQTVQKMALRRNTMKENLADMVKHKYPDVQGVELLKRIDHAANANALGAVSYVDKKSQSQFKNQYNELMMKSPDQALSLFNQTMSTAGNAIEGQDSYRRAYAMDLAGKDKSLAYLIPMADADDNSRYDMIKDAAIFKRVTQETDAKESDFNGAFEGVRHNIPALNVLMESNPSMYDGIKQVIIHRAASKIGDKKGGGKADVGRFMKDAVEEMNSLYSSVGSSDGRSNFFALNRGTNYGAEDMGVIRQGMTTAPVKLFSKEKKLELIRKYAPKFKADEHTPEDHLDFILGRQIKIEPDGRKPNVHRLKIGDGILADEKTQMPYTITAEQILEFGKASVQEMKGQTRGSMLGGKL